MVTFCRKCQAMVSTEECEVVEMAKKARGRAPWEVPHIRVTYFRCVNCAGVLTKKYPQPGEPLMLKKEDFGMKTVPVAEEEE